MADSPYDSYASYLTLPQGMTAQTHASTANMAPGNWSGVYGSDSLANYNAAIGDPNAMMQRYNDILAANPNHPNDPAYYMAVMNLAMDPAAGTTSALGKLDPNFNATIAAAANNPPSGQVDLFGVPELTAPRTYSQPVQDYVSGLNTYASGLNAKYGTYGVQGRYSPSTTLDLGATGATVSTPEGVFQPLVTGHTPYEQLVNYYAKNPADSGGAYGGQFGTPITYNTPVRLIDKVTGKVLDEGVGFDAADRISGKAEEFAKTQGRDANWAFEIADPSGQGNWMSAYGETPNPSVAEGAAGVLPLALAAAFPVLAPGLGLTGLGGAAATGIGAALGSGLSGAINGNSIGSILKDAALSGAAAYGGASLGGGAPSPSGGIPSGGMLTGAAGPAIQAAADSGLLGEIIVNGSRIAGSALGGGAGALTGSLLSGIGGAFSGGGGGGNYAPVDANLSEILVTPGSGTAALTGGNANLAGILGAAPSFNSFPQGSTNYLDQLNPANQQPVQQMPTINADGSEMILYGGTGADTAALNSLLQQGVPMAAAVASVQSAINARNIPAQPTNTNPNMAPDASEITVTGSAGNIILPVAGALGAAGLGAAALGGAGSGAAAPAANTNPNMAPDASEIIVTANSPGGLAPAVGPAAAAGAGALAAGTAAATTPPAQTTPPKSTLEQISDYLTAGSLASGLLGNLLGGGGSGSGNNKIPAGFGAGPTDPVFTGSLPTLPTSSPFSPQSLAARPVSHTYDEWITGGYRSPESYFNNVPLQTSPSVSQPYQRPQGSLAVGGTPANLNVKPLVQPGGNALLGFARGGSTSTGGSHLAVRGPGTGRSDDILAMLSDGEYVMDAETVALLGDGSNEAGAQKLDRLRVNVRKHKGRDLARGNFSVKAKEPERYLKGRK